MPSINPESKFRLPEVERWMFDEALPYWSTKGLDGPGLGFVEQVALDGGPFQPGFKRLRVQARQIYTFCHAAELGWKGPALEVAKAGIDFILSRAWLPQGGWCRRFSASGEQIDSVLDAYEQAFALFAFGWYYRLTRDPAILAQAHRTLDAMQARLGRPDGEGFLTQTPGCDHLQQNPHMHFLEAMLVLFQASGEQRWADEARKVLALLERRLFQHDQGVLLEFFALDWTPAPGERGRIVEPGHHYEWIWLLGQCTKVLGWKDGAGIADRLFAFAERHGADSSGVVYDALLDDGEVLRHDHRTWQQTEALKGYIARAEATGKDQSAGISRSVGILLDRYLATKTRGIWTDHLGRDLQPESPSVPASTLYHVFLAFAELQRWSRSRA